MNKLIKAVERLAGKVNKERCRVVSVTIDTYLAVAEAKVHLSRKEDFNAIPGDVIKESWPENKDEPQYIFRKKLCDGVYYSHCESVKEEPNGQDNEESPESNGNT
jgi:hypothetical protein